VGRQICASGSAVSALRAQEKADQRLAESGKAKMKTRWTEAAGLMSVASGVSARTWRKDEFDGRVSSGRRGFG
jgi:hypothetical protein